MTKLLATVVSGILGLWLAIQFVPGVEFTGSWEKLIWAGAILGLINIFIKPIVKLITLPIRLLTLGLFGIIINVVIIWVIDFVFPELIIEGIVPLLWTTIIVGGLGFLLPKAART